NGIRMRRWFFDEPANRLGLEPVGAVCARYGIPRHVVPTVNCDETRDVMRRLNADLGVSLGNSYIARSVFSIPRYGMINIHHELLPEFAGAQSVLWQLHEGSAVTGYTVHQINAAIDGGAILHRREIPIDFKPTLHETVVATCAALYVRSIDGLLETLDRYETLAPAAAAQPSEHRRSFTTP